MSQEFGGSGAEGSDLKVTHTGDQLVLVVGRGLSSSLFGPFYRLLECTPDMTSGFPKRE